MVTFVLFLLWGLGIFIGTLISAIVQRPEKEPYFYLTGQLIIFGTIATFLTYTFVENKYNDANYENVEDNEAHNTKYFTDDTYKNQVQIAYDTLRKRLGVNSFRLNGNTVIVKDTIPADRKQSVYEVGFWYTKQKDASIYKSAFAVFNDKAYWIYHDHDVEKEELQKRGSAAFEVQRSFREAIKQLPDSVRKKLEDDLNNEIRD